MAIPRNHGKQFDPPELLKRAMEEEAKSPNDPTNIKDNPRVAKESDEGRLDRAMLDRLVTESRDLTDEQRLAAYRMQFYQDALPDLPKIPGYHCIWLSTENKYDPIPKRMRMGYEPIKAAEIPGWEHSSIRTGEWQGYVGVQEMLAFKIKDHLYRAYLEESHHHAPEREARKLTDTADLIREQAQARGATVHEGSGMRDLRQRTPGPKFNYD